MATIKKAQSGAKTTKKPKTASQRIGDLTMRDLKNSAETALNISTLGGYGVVKKGVKKLTGMKSGGTMKKAQNGVNTLLPGGYAPKALKDKYGGMPSRSKAKAKSTIEEATPQQVKKYGMLGTQQAKTGAKMKKAQGGVNMLLPGAYTPKSRDEKYNTYPSVKPAPKAKAKPKSSIQKATPQEIEKYGMLGTRSAKSGGSVKKCKYGCK